MDPSTHDGREHARTISPELLRQLLASGQRITIVDVRGSAEFHGPSGRLPGARWLPMGQILGRNEELDVHRNELVVVVSRGGRRSQLAAYELELAGFNEVCSLEGGLRRWIELGFPIEHASVPPPFAPADRSDSCAESQP